jgi:hypothetical protein
VARVTARTADDGVVDELDVVLSDARALHVYAEPEPGPTSLTVV